MKKLITSMIVSTLLISYTIPVLAIENTNKITQIDLSRKAIQQRKVQPVQNKYEYVNLRWWENFNDPLLNNYIIRAIENNQDLKIASLAVDEYYQRVLTQHAGEMPSVYTGFLPGYAKGSRGLFALPLIMSYELDLFGKNHDKTTSVKKSWEATILDERSAYISVAAAVGSAYINIVKLDALIDAQQEIVNLRKEIYEIMSVANSEGIISTSDLVQANKAYTAGITDLTELKKNRTKMLNALAVLVGDSPNNIEEYKRISYDNLKYTGVIPKSVSSEVITQRPDYLKAEKMLEKSGIDVKIAKKEMLPSITIGGGVIFNNRYLESLFSTSKMLAGIGGGLIQPAFLGGKLKANLKSKKIAYEKSLKNYEKVNLTSIQEINNSLVSVNLDQEKLQKQKEIQKLEQTDFALSNEKYKEGVIAKLDLNQKHENLLMVNKMVYTSNFDCLIDYISYYKAVGAKNI